MPHKHPWRELLLAYLCLVLSNTVLYAGPVYRAAAATAMGWSQEAVTGAFALGFLVVMPVPFFTGWVADRWGARLVLAGDMLIAALGLLGAAAISAVLTHARRSSTPLPQCCCPGQRSRGTHSGVPDVLGKQRCL